MTSSKKVIGTRNKAKSNEDNLLLALNFAGITAIAVGKEIFKNSKHKGYKIVSHGVHVGDSDGIQNIYNLLVIEGKLEGLGIQGSKELLKFHGGLEIFSDYKHLFATETLKRFARVEFRDHKGTATPEAHKNAQELKRINGLKAKLVRLQTSQTKNWEAKAEKLIQLIRELEA